MTGYEMADRLVISRDALINWERGEKEPHAVEILEKMAEIFQMSLKELLAGKNENEIENNPIIKDLQNRVGRLEKILNQTTK